MQIQSGENYEREHTLLKKRAAMETVAFFCNWKCRLKKIRIYRMCLMGLLVISCISLFGVIGIYLDESIPDVIQLRSDKEDSFWLRIPAKGKIISVNGSRESNIPKGAVDIDLSDRVTMKLPSQADYEMQVKLFGLIPLKQVEIHAIEDVKLIPVGKPIGIYVKTKGVLVVGTGSFKGRDGMQYSPGKNIVKSGDYILAVNDTFVNKKDEVIRLVEESVGEAVNLRVVRGDEVMDLRIFPKEDNTGVYKIGVWVRDSAQGVGTLTYVDEQGRFGALGHGINDVDTSTLMQMQGGNLYETDIVEVKRATTGKPGEISGMIVYSSDHKLGEIKENTLRGIFGICNAKSMKLCEEEPISIGLKQEIETGPAKIICALDGKAEYYDIEITDIHMDHDNINRGIELRVTDDRLLQKTGGIVQGMSGSPIIQNGKFIGAVTHVLVQDSSRGYGIFIENMLEQSENIRMR